MLNTVAKDVEDVRSLVWFRNDLRFSDHTGLAKACQNSKRLFGIYCFDPKLFINNKLGFPKMNVYRAAFILESIKELKAELLKRNISLIVKIGEPNKVISEFIKDYKINSIYYQNEWTDEEIGEEKALLNNISTDVEVQKYSDQFLYHPDDVDQSFVSDVFTTFRKYCEKNLVVRDIVEPTYSFSKENLINENQNNLPTLEDLGLNDFEMDSRTAFPFTGGCLSAKDRLNYYLWESKKVNFYKKTRNGLLGKDYSSKFSAWLANGSISSREIYWQIKNYEKDIMKNQSTYWMIFELIWRDFFKFISLKYGNKIFKIGGILDKDYTWSRDEDQFQNWIDGKTNEPFVNANMIELKSTGWMSNRGRQNVASFLSKELLIDWRWGASYFESMLIDYDVHSNYGNWMYVSGVGNDPRDRKFNIKFQADRYDPNNKFQNLWLQGKLFV
tara:strand:- start:3393 stop:4721 length:1329 start_codon:yes stop_codon:yes gene_type:complete